MTEKQPTQEQRKEFWERCGFKLYEDIQGEWKGCFYWHNPPNTDRWGATWLPPIDLINLGKYAVPFAVSKLESRFDPKTNLVRGLELLFAKWIDKIREGYSLEDALFWAMWEVIRNG